MSSHQLVLIVEDAAALRRIIARKLGEYGLVAQTTESGLHLKVRLLRATAE